MSYSQFVLDSIYLVTQLVFYVVLFYVGWKFSFLERSVPKAFSKTAKDLEVYLHRIMGLLVALLFILIPREEIMNTTLRYVVIAGFSVLASCIYCWLDLLGKMRNWKTSPHFFIILPLLLIVAQLFYRDLSPLEVGFCVTVPMTLNLVLFSSMIQSRIYEFADSVEKNEIDNLSQKLLETLVLIHQNVTVQSVLTSSLLMLVYTSVCFTLLISPEHRLQVFPIFFLMGLSYGVIYYLAWRFFLIYSAVITFALLYFTLPLLGDMIPFPTLIYSPILLIAFCPLFLARMKIRLGKKKQGSARAR